MIGPVRVVPWTATRLIAICGKCGKKLGGGFGTDGNTSLAKALRRSVAGATGKRAKVRIIETKCLEFCPKRAVVLVDSAQPGSWMLVAQGASVDTLRLALGLARIAADD